jgi:mRNA-degrading endonuclease RelE of RelBE toxin-antitoxin system
MIALVAEYPEIGTPLSEPWEGARAVHCADDAYRIIWESDAERNAVVVLLVGKKMQRGMTIYGLSRPAWPPT